LSAFGNVHHKASKNFGLQACVNTSKEKPNTTKGVTRTDSLITSHSTTLILDSNEMSSNSVLYLAENWRKDTVLFVLRNRKLEMLVVETQPKLFMEDYFYWPTYL